MDLTRISLQQVAKHLHKRSQEYDKEGDAYRAELVGNAAYVIDDEVARDVGKVQLKRTKGGNHVDGNS